MGERDQAPRRRLWRRAAGQRGYFTAAQALEDGYSYPAQRYHVQRGNWIRIDRGIYRFCEFTDLPAGEHDHLMRWILWGGGRAVLSHATALDVHDLGIANPAKIHLTVPRSFRKRTAGAVLHRANLDPDDVHDHEGLWVTTPLRAITESAADRADQDVIDTAVADLLDRGRATRTQILHAAQRMGPRAELAIERALHRVPQ